jgi:hypothetical protein
MFFVFIFRISIFLGVNSSNTSCCIEANECHTVCWFRAAFFQVSWSLSRPYSEQIFQRSLFYRKNVKSICLGLCPYVSARHRTSLIWLLIISGDVELNPGPTLSDFTVPILKKTLILLKQDEADYKISTNITKSDLIGLLEKEKPHLVQLALNSVVSQSQQTQSQQSLSVGTQPSASNANRSDEESIFKTIKLAPFFENDTRRWFDQVQQLLIGANETVRKNSLLRVLPTHIIRDTGVDVTADFDTIRDRIITHFDDTQDQKLRKLLDQQELGDQKPSTALRRLQDLSGG